MIKVWMNFWKCATWSSPRKSILSKVIGDLQLLLPFCNWQGKSFENWRLSRSRKLLKWTLLVHPINWHWFLKMHVSLINTWKSSFSSWIHFTRLFRETKVVLGEGRWSLFYFLIVWILLFLFGNLSFFSRLCLFHLRRSRKLFWVLFLFWSF